MRVSGNPSRQDSLSNYIDSDDEVDGMLDNVDEEEDGDYEDEQGIATPKRPLQKDFIVTQYSVALRFYAKVSNVHVAYFDGKLLIACCFNYQSPGMQYN